jgi:cyanophycinase
MSRKPRGTLIIIGGHEDKDPRGEREILKEVTRRANHGGKSLVIVAVASQYPREVIAEYHEVFEDLGVKRIVDLGVRSRDEAYQDEAVEKLRHASVVFFTGGDQLRISSQIGDSPTFRCLEELYHNGATIAGTSAGAAAMPDTMLIAGPRDSSNRISALGMAPGLGFLPGVVIDSHFAERGRFGRLLGAVAQNPKNIGLGIDEDTAIVVERGERFTVLGSGAIYVVDGTGIGYSSLSEKNPEGVLSIFGAKLHVLGHGDRFDLLTRRPEVAVDDGEEQSE